MKFKLKDINKALDYIRYNGKMDATSDIEIAIREEDFENNKVGSLMVFSASSVKEPSSYERVKTNKNVTITVEVFPESENRQPRVILLESQVLDDER